MQNFESSPATAFSAAHRMRNETVCALAPYTVQMRNATVIDGAAATKTPGSYAWRQPA